MCEFETRSTERFNEVMILSQDLWQLITVQFKELKHQHWSRFTKDLHRVEQ